MKKLIAVILVIAILSVCMSACAPTGLMAGGLTLLLTQCTAKVEEQEVFLAPMEEERIPNYDLDSFLEEEVLEELE